MSLRSLLWYALMAWQKVRSPALRRDREMLGVLYVRLRFRDTTAPCISNFLHSHRRYFLRVHHCCFRLIPGRHPGPPGILPIPDQDDTGARVPTGPQRTLLPHGV